MEFTSEQACLGLIPASVCNALLHRVDLFKLNQLKGQTRVSLHRIALLVSAGRKMVPEPTWLWQTFPCKITLKEL